MQWRGVEPTCCTARSPVVSERAILWWSVRFKLLWNAGQVAKEASRGSRWDCWATAAASCLCSRHQSQARLLKQQGDQIKLEDPAIFSKNPRFSLLSNYLMTKWFQIWWSYVKNDTRGHQKLVPLTTYFGCNALYFKTWKKLVQKYWNSLSYLY